LCAILHSVKLGYLIYPYKSL